MSFPVTITPEIPIDDWYNNQSNLIIEDQIINAILNNLDSNYQKSFLQASLADIPNPSSMKDIEIAVELFIQAILQKKKVLVVGDYDVDGITSTALLIRMFRQLGFDRFESFIPNRFLHGYGLTEKTVKVIQSANPELVITVDNGITARNEIEQIKQSGTDVIVTDHHLPQDSMTPECAILNPKQESCQYPFEELSGVGVVFMFLVAVRTRLREMGFWLNNGKEPNLAEHLDLVALGTIADQVPLLGLNRIFAKFGLNRMTKSLHEGKSNSFYSYLRVFAEKTSTKSFNSESIAFNLAPLLNATGRMKDAEEGLNFLLSDNDQVADSRYQYLERLNQKRRKKQQIMTKKAQQQAEDLLNDDMGIVIYNESFHEGLIGVVASRLVDQFYFPSIVVTDGENGILKASCRSKNQNIIKILSRCDDLLLQYGGHANAAGCSLKKENLEEFHQKYTDVCAELIPKNSPQAVQAGIEVKLDMMTFSLIDKLKILEPYGHKNRKPVFYVSRVKLPVPTTMTGKHLKWVLEPDLELIHWNGADTHKHGNYYDLAVTLGENNFRGEKKRQMIVNSMVARN